MNKYNNASLPLCILMDLIGYASFSLPGLGEFADLVWAPVSAYVFFKIFGGKKGAIGGAFAFLEEILPFTDFIPSFTLMWLWNYFSKGKVIKVG
jgi:hypothetical protein